MDTKTLYERHRRYRRRVVIQSIAYAVVTAIAIIGWAGLMWLVL